MGAFTFGLENTMALNRISVCSGLTYAQLYNQTADQAVTSKVNDESQFREKFQNLFDSIAMNNAKKSDIYHDILKQEVARDRQAFDVMKEELQMAQGENANKRRNFYVKSNISENIIATKRETKKKKRLGIGTYTRIRSGNRGRHKPPEFDMEFEDDKFVEKYGNNNETSGLWEPVRNILEDEEKIKTLCTQAHKLCFQATPNLTGTGFYVKELTFINSPQYQPMSIDVLVYTGELLYQAPNTPYLYHFTKGLEADCVYYLVPLDPSQIRVQLQEHVCGLKFSFET